MGIQTKKVRGPRKPSMTEALLRLPPGVTATPIALAAGELRAAAEAERDALVAQGQCQGGHPAVTLELYGSLRLKSGRASLPLRADTVGTALNLLLTLFPALSQKLPPPPELFEHYRVSINGRTLVRDHCHALNEGDHLILFSANVGG